MSLIARCSKIICVGRNYAAHAKELGNVASKEEPVIFLKPPSALLQAGNSVRMPPGASELHHEVELAVVMGEGARIAGYGVALDMTDRRKQSELKAKGLPWSLAKSFDTSCPMSDVIATTQLPESVELFCDVNGERRQCGSTSDMIFSIGELISFISKYFTLMPGDVILTGTPEGVGPVKSGDTIKAGISGSITIEVDVA